MRRQKCATFWVYRLVVTSRTGSVQHWARQYPPNSCPYFVQDDRTNENFFTGAALAYLGTGAQLDADLYEVQWGNTVAPPQVRAGETFTVITRLFNRSRLPWTADGSARVNLAYHWLDESGKQCVEDGLRTPMPWPVPPGGRVERAAEGDRAEDAGALHPGARPGVRDGGLVRGEERRQDAAHPDRDVAAGAAPVREIRCSITCARTPAGCARSRPSRSPGT